MKKTTVSIIALIIISLSCKSGHESQNADFKSMDYAVNDEIIPIARQDAEIVEPPQAPVMGQMLIKNIYLSIEVESYEASRPLIDSLTRVHKAWIASENFNNSDFSISNDIAIRVPTESLELLKKDIISLAKMVNYQRVESFDVTEEYIDVESRMKNLKKIEDTFSKLLRKTDSIEDILKIESKLAEVRGEIESFEGRMRYMKNRVQFSTIQLTVLQKIEYKYVPEASERFLERFKKSLHNGWEGLVSFVLFLFTLWPLYLVAGITGYLVNYFRKKKQVEPVKLSKKEKEREKKRLKKQQLQIEKVDVQENKGV